MVICIHDFCHACSPSANYELNVALIAIHSLSMLSMLHKLLLPMAIMLAAGFFDVYTTEGT